MDKRAAKIRRAKRTRCRLKQHKKTTYLTVHRTPKHIYAQVISPEGKVLACASTVSKDAKSELASGGNINGAIFVGAKIAKLCIDRGIERVAFDRSGFKYHGRVKALADAARENGLKI